MRMVAWLLHFYPRRWRERYYDEMLAVLEQHTISFATILDMLLGAFDAWLDPAYRTREGFMFYKLRDPRILSIIYMCALAIFLFSVELWLYLNGALSFQDNSLGSTTEAIAVAVKTVIIPGLSLLATLAMAFTLIKDTLKSRRCGTLLFVLFCFGLGIAGVFQAFPSTLSVAPDYPLMDLIFIWLLLGGVALSVGAALFVGGVKGLQAIRQRQWWPLGFALAISLLFPAGLLGYRFWGTGYQGGTTIYPPGSFRLGNATFPSGALFLMDFLLEIGPYLLMGALLLTLACNELKPRSWRVTRGFGIVLALVLAVGLAAVVIWDVNRWLGGNVGIFFPTNVIWQLFGEQWFSALMTNVLLLAVAFGLALFALIRSFLIQPEQPAEQVTA